MRADRVISRRSWYCGAMKTKRKVVAKTLPERNPAGRGGGRVFSDGQIIQMLPGGNGILRLRNGQEAPCRRPSTIDQGWLRAALVVGPVDADRQAGSQHLARRHLGLRRQGVTWAIRWRRAAITI